MQHVLVVEDDEDLAAPLSQLFESGGFDAAVVARGDEAIVHVREVETDLVILDLMLPDMDGIDVCGAMRENGFDGGLIMVTARTDELDVVAGLDAGADDYVVKPCSIAELQSRVRSVLRRVRRWQAPGEERVGLVVGEHQITYAGREILTPGREYDVLAMLVEQTGLVVTHEALMRRVWGEDWSGSAMVLPSAIGRIRERLVAAGVPVLVDNVRGVGFRLTYISTTTLPTLRPEST